MIEALALGVRAVVEKSRREAEARDERKALRSRDKAVHFLQYEVREGREASEAVVDRVAIIANCNDSFIL